MLYEQQDTSSQTTLPILPNIQPTAPNTPISQGLFQKPRTKFNLFFAVGLILLIALFIGGWWMYQSYYNGDKGVFISGDKGVFISGEIFVSFKPETSERDARAVLEKYHLKVPEHFFQVSVFYVNAYDNNLDAAVVKLKKIAFVNKAVIVENYRPIGKPVIDVITFNPMSRDEINATLKSIGNLYVQSFGDFAVIKVPPRMEQYYSKRLGKEPTVEYTQLHYQGPIW